MVFKNVNYKLDRPLKPERLKFVIIKAKTSANEQF